MPANSNLDILHEFRPLLQYSQLGSIFESPELEELRNLFLYNFKISGRLFALGDDREGGT